jgi:hypothetical protein
LRGFGATAYRSRMGVDLTTLTMLSRVAGALLLLALPEVAAAAPANLGRIDLREPAPALLLAQQEAPDAEATPRQAVEPPLPPILRSETELPEAVRATRTALMEAARSGDMERLRTLMEAQPEPPSVSLGDPGDPIDYLKALSGDAEGREILAILLEVLESGFAHVGAGTPEELYVWPYFAQYPLEALSAAQVVELFTLLTAADFEDMKAYGGYTFFRVGIAPDGRWLFFVAGD